MSHGQRWLALLAVLAALAAPRTSAAWNQSGHLQIAACSDDSLSEATRASLVALLRQHPRVFEPDATVRAKVARIAMMNISTGQIAPFDPDLQKKLQKKIPKKLQKDFQKGSWHLRSYPPIIGRA